MNKKTTNSLFTVSSLKQFGALYQQLLTQSLSFTELGSRLVSIAEQARVFRVYGVVSEAARLLINLPINEYQLIGKYYLAWHGLMKGSFVKPTLEVVAEQAPPKYRALAMHSLAAIESYSRNYEAELAWLLESMKIVPSVDVLRGVAVVKAKEGFHNSAIKDLENLTALISHAEPFVYYDFLNSYAVELGEAGRFSEARNVSQMALASPFAFAYPEWHETAEELKGASRSRVAVNHPLASNANLLHLPAVEYGTREGHYRATRPALVISLPEWKKKMVNDAESNQSDEVIPTDLDKLTHNDLKVQIFELACREEMTTESLRDILRYIIEKHYRKHRTNPDDK